MRRQPVNQNGEQVIESRFGVGAMEQAKPHVGDMASPAGPQRGGGALRLAFPGSGVLRETCARDDAVSHRIRGSRSDSRRSATAGSLGAIP